MLCKSSWSEKRSKYAFSRRLLLEFRRPSPSILFSHHVSQNDALRQQLTLSEEIRNSQELRLRVAHELDVSHPTCHLVCFHRLVFDPFTGRDALRRRRRAAAEGRCRRCAPFYRLVLAETELFRCSMKVEKSYGNCERYNCAHKFKSNVHDFRRDDASNRII